MAEKTPGASWRENGEPDPHGTRYDCPRSALAFGSMTDDELANGVFLYGDVRPSPQQIISGKAHSTIAWLTAAKDRIRWLSRRVERMRDVVKANNDWHIDNDDSGGYIDSELHILNSAALQDLPLKAGANWSITRGETGGIRVASPEGDYLVVFKSGRSSAEQLLHALAETLLKENGNG